MNSVTLSIIGDLRIISNHDGSQQHTAAHYLVRSGITTLATFEGTCLNPGWRNNITCKYRTCHDISLSRILQVRRIMGPLHAVW